MEPIDLSQIPGYLHDCINKAPKSAGVYVIHNTATGKVYVGSAAQRKGFARRWYAHALSLRRGEHHSRKLQASWNKHGAAAFTFRILEVVSDKGGESDDLIARMIEAEQRWIDLLDSFNAGYNATPKAYTALGMRHTEEAKRKMSAAKKGLGKPVTHETRQRMSEARKGRKMSDAMKAKLSAAKMGNDIGAEGRRKISEAAKLRVVSAETRAKQSAYRQGKPVHTDESRRKIAESNSRRGVSEETRQKMSEAHRGRKCPPEVVAKRTATRLANLAAKKAMLLAGD